MALPTPLRLLEGGVTLMDTDRDQILARLWPRSL
jgi:hypothetical protein